MLGASGALIGTRFYACHESLGQTKAKQLIVQGSGDDTLRSNIFDYARGLSWPAPYTARTLQNKFTQQWHNNASLQTINHHQQQRYLQAVAAGDFDIAGVFAGECIDLIHSIASAETIIKSIVEDCEKKLGNYSPCRWEHQI